MTRSVRRRYSPGDDYPAEVRAALHAARVAIADAIQALTAREARLLSDAVLREHKENDKKMRRKGLK